MAITWPVDVNAQALRDTYSEQPERNVAAFKPEVGPPKERRRSSVTSRLVSFTGKYTKEEWVSLLAFYETALLEGVLPFDFVNPLTEVIETYKFVDAPRLVSVRSLKVQAVISLRRLP